MGEGVRYRSIDHVRLGVPPGELGRAVAFYADVLGLREVPRPAESGSGEGAWLADGDVQVHLGADEGFAPAPKAHPAFRVDGFDALVARCAAAGVLVSEAASLAGRRRAHLRDPFGNRIELVEDVR